MAKYKQLRETVRYKSGNLRALNEAMALKARASECNE